MPLASSRPTISITLLMRGTASLSEEAWSSSLTALRRASCSGVTKGGHLGLSELVGQGFHSNALVAYADRVPHGMLERRRANARAGNIGQSPCLRHGKRPSTHTVSACRADAREGDPPDDSFGGTAIAFRLRACASIQEARRGQQSDHGPSERRPPDSEACRISFPRIATVAENPRTMATPTAARFRAP